MVSAENKREIKEQILHYINFTCGSGHGLPWTSVKRGDEYSGL
jgi:hypothetical protein